MAFTPYYPGGWQSGEDGGTPITPDALNHYDNYLETTYTQTETDAAIAQSTTEALDGVKFVSVFLAANTPKTITVSNSARCMVFFVSSYNACCGEAALAHYSSGHSDGPIWFREATNITINTSTDGRIVLTATQNTYCSIMVLTGTYAEA